MKTTAINTTKAPKAVGPYSQAIKAGNLVFCSGQIGISPKTNQLVKGGINKETKQVLNNLTQVLKSAGSDLNKVVKTEIYLKDISNFENINQIYSQFFKTDPKPARVTVEVSKLPKNAAVEISCIAYLEGNL